MSGVGTGQTVALWEGASSVTDSETLGNAPITVSGSDTTFSGNVTIDRSTDGSLIFESSGASKFLVGYDSSPTGFRVYNYVASETALFIDATNSNATFAGSINGGDINLSSTNNAIIDPLSVGNILRFTDNDPTQNNNQITGTIEWETKDSNNPGIQSFITTNSTNQGKGRLVFGTGLGGSAVEKMRIDSDGNVGIGVTSPNAKLVVKGSGLVSQDFFHIEDSGGVRMLEAVSDAAGNANLQIKNTLGVTKV